MTGASPRTGQGTAGGSGGRNRTSQTTGVPSWDQTTYFKTGTSWSSGCDHCYNTSCRPRCLLFGIHAESQARQIRGQDINCTVVVAVHDIFITTKSIWSSGFQHSSLLPCRSSWEVGFFSLDNSLKTSLESIRQAIHNIFKPSSRHND